MEKQSTSRSKVTLSPGKTEFLATFKLLRPKPTLELLLAYFNLERKELGP